MQASESLQACDASHALAGSIHRGRPVQQRVSLRQGRRNAARSACRQAAAVRRDKRLVYLYHALHRLAGSRDMLEQDILSLSESCSGAQLPCCIAYSFTSAEPSAYVG